MIDLGQLFFSGLEPGNEFQVGPARFNIAPTQNILCVHHDLQSEQLTAVEYRWGLIPAWSKDIAIGARMINARSETLDSKPSFKHAFASRRCLIPMDGYYEWATLKSGKVKQPFLIEPVDGQVRFMAGLWEENQRLDGEGAIRSCTIVTTPANATTAHIHQRMPAFIDESGWSAWLDPQCKDLSKLKMLLRPAEEKLFKLLPVSRHVNSPQHEDARCVSPLHTPAKEQQFIRFD